MSVIKRKIYTLFHTEHIFTKKLEGSFFYKLMPDKMALDLLYYNRFGKRIDWDNPTTFNEKIQWLKVYNRNLLYTKLVDKYAVKEWVADIIGKEYVIPTYGIWDSFDEIDFNKLPDQFVLKTTHGGGSSGVVICREKSTFNYAAAKVKLSNSLKTNSYLVSREWPYKDVQRRILAERYLEPMADQQDLPDYKWFCFNGEPAFCQVIQNRSLKETIDFFDTEWCHQDFVGLNPDADMSDNPPKCPKNLTTHLSIAKKLSKEIPFSRIDLYDYSDVIFFGEITFFPTSGTGSFRPEKYNTILGEMIKLPIISK